MSGKDNKDKKEQEIIIPIVLSKSPRARKFTVQNN